MASVRIMEIMLDLLETMYATPADKAHRGPDLPWAGREVNGMPVTEAESAEAVQAAANEGYVVLADNWPVPIKLAPAGRRFVQEWSRKLA